MSAVKTIHEDFGCTSYCRRFGCVEEEEAREAFYGPGYGDSERLDEIQAVNEQREAEERDVQISD
jgi:hypothetical protein